MVGIILTPKQGERPLPESGLIAALDEVSAAIPRDAVARNGAVEPLSRARSAAKREGPVGSNRGLSGLLHHRRRFRFLVAILPE